MKETVVRPVASSDSTPLTYQCRFSALAYWPLSRAVKV